MYSELSYFDKSAAEKPPHRRSNKWKKLNSYEKWAEACTESFPNYYNLPEEAREMIEAKVKVDYYIALGSDPSLPRTVTSGSIQTPKPSSLFKRPPKGPSRAPVVPPLPTRQLSPLGPLPPLPLYPNLPLPSPVSPIPHLLSVSPLAHPSFVPNNPYISPFYQPEDDHLVARSSSHRVEYPYPKDPYPLRRPDRQRYYDPSSTALLATKSNQSFTGNFNYPSVYHSQDEFYKLGCTEVNNNDNEQPIDYSCKALNYASGSQKNF